ncbi:MAG: Phosphate transport system permease protein PstC 1 [Methanobacteriota archaeon]|nr:MAG: Phosphate transport system permease protein PstC 1 [Euryarchaeota archaeon]
MVKNKIDWPYLILFLMGASVILITVGIIQTLLVETLGFFSEVAESRGWFNIEWDISGIFSNDGFGCLIIFSCLILELIFSKEKQLTSNFPSFLVNVNNKIKIIISLFLLLFLFFLESFWIGVSLICLTLIVYRISIIKDVYLRGAEEKAVWIRPFFLFCGLSALLASITSGFGGALGEFFFQTEWLPSASCPDRRSLCESMSFGVNGLLLTTMQVAFGALIIAIPLGVGTAVYLSEFASPRIVAIVKPTLEILAGIPSVVYGFFALIYIGPLVVELGNIFYENGWIDAAPSVLNPLNGAIVVGIMVLPLIASLSEDALRAVPNELREGSHALGATKIETTTNVMIPASLSGILASIILALSRAVGETMAVTLAVGTMAAFTANMFLPAQTMTAYIAQRVGGDLPFGEIGYYTIFAVGMYLFVITLSLNLLGNKILEAYREAY